MLGAKDRMKGAWWGAFAADALSMPVHGYSTRDFIEKDYGFISDMQAPKEPYRDFVLAGSSIPELPKEFDYIGSTRRKDWTRLTTHPHKHLQAGENTLPMILALHQAICIANSGGFDLNSWMERYKAVMTSENGHRDTFIPSIHRRYFDNLAKGKDPETNGCPDAHISDIIIFFPLIFTAYLNPKKAHEDLIHAIRKFSIGENTLNTSLFMMEIFFHIFSGTKLEDILYKKMNPDRHYALAYPYRRWIKAANDDESMAHQIGRTAELDKAIVLSLYLALKYGSDYESAIVANANMGGETTGRGALIGALIAGQYGAQAIPAKWGDKLVMSGEIAACGNALLNYVFKPI